MGLDKAGLNLYYKHMLSSRNPQLNRGLLAESDFSQTGNIVVRGGK
jgi:hypothetical protein